MRRLIYGIKNLIKWFPIIWKDRDWDYYYTMEIFKKKLLFSAKHMRKYGHLENSIKYAEQMEDCAFLMHVVQNEVYLDEVILKKDSTDEDLKKAADAQNEARERLFKIMNENIEHWWN